MPTSTLRNPRLPSVLTALALLCTPAALDAQASRPATSSAAKSSRAAATPSPGSKARPRGDALSGVVNLNTASATELERLPGIGPAKAEAILELRKRLKRFSRIEQLMRVRGIGRKTFRKLRTMLSVSGTTTLGSKAAGAGRSQATRSTSATR